MSKIIMTYLESAFNKTAGGHVQTFNNRKVWALNIIPDSFPVLLP